MIDSELARLIAAPFSRSTAIARVERLIARYQLSITLGRDPRGAMMRLLYEHPSALLEQASVDPDMLEARLESARLELANLRAAAPLPPPPDRMERALVLAFSELEHLLGELRVVRRMLRRLPPEPLVAWYREPRRRRDPLQPCDAQLVRAIGRIPRGGSLRAAAAIAGARYGIADLRNALAPRKPKQPDATGHVFACKASAIGEGCAVRVDAFGRAIAVFRNKGSLFAIDDVCPHRGGSLHLGDVEKDAAVCPLHGWAFDLETGQMRGNPRLRLPIYDLELRGDDVYVGGPIETLDLDRSQ
jgi:nitrite reductase/ring-hydroxylating ferredoxin subunit